MMRVILLLVLAVGVGFGTMRLVQQWLAGQRAQEQVADAVAEPASSFVLVANGDLSAGTFLGPESLRWQAWPSATLAPGYILKDQRTIEEFAGAVVRSRVTGGEPITDQRVVKPGDRGFLAAVLQPGMRAVSVPVDETRGVAGLVFPGDRVDLILSHSVQNDTGSEVPPTKVSETVLADIRVLAIDQTIDDQTTEPQVAKTATLEVTPRQVETIAVMLELGSLSLSLRSLSETPDGASTAVAGAAEADVTGFAALIKTMTRHSAEPAAVAGQTYTLDTDVSMVLRRPRPAPMTAKTPMAASAPAAPAVIVFRGSASRSAGAAPTASTP